MTVSTPLDSSSGTQDALQALRVCYFGTFRAGYSRNQILIKGLRRSGAQVLICHEPLWSGIEDRVQAASGGWRSMSFWVRLVRVYVRLLRRYWRMRHDYDVLVVGYPGQFDIFLARLLSWISGKPLAWDVFMSIYLIAHERALHHRSESTVAALRWIEALACRLPDQLVIDTESYARWFEATHKVPARRFALVPTGADSDRFRPVARVGAPPPLVVLYYGTFIPNHGTETIVAAARLLAHRPIQFVLAGDGPDREHAERAAADLPGVSFPGWQSQEAIEALVAGADVLLGAFGTTPQSLMTVQNKLYEGMAMARPVISGRGPAVGHSFVQGEHLLLVERANARALADAILLLETQPALRMRLAERGNQRFRGDFTVEQLGARYAAILRDLVADRTGER